MTFHPSFLRIAMNKSLVLLSGLLLAVAMPASAQTVLGFHAGANIATLGGDDVQDAESRTGMNIGASVLFPIGENLGLSIGGGWSEKGATVSETEGDLEFKLAYVEFPVMLRYAFPTSGSVGFHLMGGGALGVESKCELEGSDGGVTVTVDCSEAGFDTKSMDFGLVGGGGVDFDITDGMELFVDLLYTLGLTNIDDSADAADAKNRAFTIRGGISIPLS